jgi:hypothetical protein
MRRLLVLAGTVAAAGVGAYAAASAGLSPFTSASVSAGNEALLPCDSDGFAVTYTTSGGNVTSATVADITDPECEGGDLSLTLTDAGSAAIASGGPQAIPADGDSSPNSVAVALTPAPTAELVAGFRIVVTGP